MTNTNPDNTSAEVIPLAESEKALIALAKQRDQKAFKSLYDLHIARVYSLCLRLCGNKYMAEEATQEVFITLWRKVHLFAGQSAFSTWLYRLATNTTLSYLRKHKSWFERIKNSDDFEAASESTIEAAPYEAGADLSKLDGFIARLPERARIIFVLHALEGYRHGDIATKLKISIGTSKAQFHRAKGLIKQWLDDAS